MTVHVVAGLAMIGGSVAAMTALCWLDNRARRRT